MAVPLISIIVPLYNNENYIAECLESILAQTYPDFEILVINDGSTDCSEAVVLHYCQKDSRIKYFYKENGGVSSARNMGIEKAAGEYICFVDSDDTVKNNYLQLLYDNLQDADISIGNLKSSTVGGIELKPGVYTLKEFKNQTENVYCTRLMNPPFNKIFRKDIIEKNNIRFNQNMIMGEDLIFNTDYMNCCEKIAVFDADIYNYRENQSSVSNNYKPKHYYDRQAVADRLIKFFGLDTINSQDAKVLKARLVMDLVYSEIIRNPARKADMKTMKALMAENGVLAAVNDIRLGASELFKKSKGIFMLRYKLYWVYLMVLKKDKRS